MCQARLRGFEARPWVVVTQQAGQVVEGAVLGPREGVRRCEPTSHLDCPEALVSPSERRERRASGDKRICDDLDEIMSLREGEHTIRDEDCLLGVVIQEPRARQLAVKHRERRFIIEMLEPLGCLGQECQCRLEVEEAQECAPVSGGRLRLGDRIAQLGTERECGFEMPFREVHSLGHPGETSPPAREVPPSRQDRT